MDGVTPGPWNVQAGQSRCAVNSTGAATLRPCRSSSMQCPHIPPHTMLRFDQTRCTGQALEPLHSSMHKLLPQVDTHSCPLLPFLPLMRGTLLCHTGGACVPVCVSRYTVYKGVKIHKLGQKHLPCGTAAAAQHVRAWTLSIPCSRSTTYQFYQLPICLDRSTWCTAMLPACDRAQAMTSCCGQGIRLSIGQAHALGWPAHMQF